VGEPSDERPGYSTMGWTPRPACPVCCSRGRSFWVARGELKLVRCASCELVFSDPQPTGLVRTLYTKTYDLAEHFAEHRARKEALFKRKLVNLPAPRSGSDRLCDVGCADGQFLRLAAARGWLPFGIEVNPPAAATARRSGVTVYEGMLEELDDLPWGTFDVVTAWDVLEHTPTPRQFVARLARLAAPGALLMLSTLNVDSAVARIRREKWSMVVPDHFTYWTPNAASCVLTEAGFELVTLSSYGLGRDLVAWADRAVARRRSLASPPAGAGPGDGSSWDSSRVVLSMEGLVNRILARLGLGMVLTVIARRSNV
jgi:SAM-dependent methyltransferase